MSTQLKIAVADDERDMRDFYHKILQRLGHDIVCVAATGAELVAGCKSELPDLIITDLKMPEMDGAAAIRTLRSSREIPAIIVTAFPEETIPDLVDEGGSNVLVLNKPIQSTNLRDAIETLFADS